jgi:hypothetical protein
LFDRIAIDRNAANAPVDLTTTIGERIMVAHTTLNEYGFTEQEALDLEALIDRRGIEQVLQQISEICGLKAQHVAEAWQGAALSRRWATVEGAVGCASTKAMGL